MNKVDNLLKNPFKNLKHEEQIEIKRLGSYQQRDINIFQKDGRKFRTFLSTWFDKKSWLTACDERKSLFCFCCLLFGGEILWTNKGSVVEWLKHRTNDQHGLGSKPTCAVLLCPWERHFTALSPAWWS